MYFFINKKLSHGLNINLKNSQKKDIKRSFQISNFKF